MLPNQVSQVEKYQLSDILTEDEKKSAIDHVIDQKKIAAARKMRDVGKKEFDVISKINSIDWLSQINIEEILAGANQRKHWVIEKEENVKKEKEQAEQERKDLLKKYDANYFFGMIRTYITRVNTNTERKGTFIFNDDNKLLISATCYLFGSDERYQTELGFDFTKGLLINGDAGFGKTKTFEAIKDNPIFPISIYSMLDIFDSVMENGSCEINTKKIILLDDVGSEPEMVNHYGTKINWFKNFIETYYHHHDDFSNLIITTNCGGEELEHKYGYRVRSRMREMFNTITVSGDDKRGMFK